MGIHRNVNTLWIIVLVALRVKIENAKADDVIKLPMHFFTVTLKRAGAVTAMKILTAVLVVAVGPASAFLDIAIKTPRFSRRVMIYEMM